MCLLSFKKLAYLEFDKVPKLGNFAKDLNESSHFWRKNLEQKHLIPAKENQTI